jgi:hypothetical protein
MIEGLIATGLAVTCSDGSCHENVELWLNNGKRIYKAPDGRKLCVELVTAGTFNVPLMIYATSVSRCPIEMESPQ